MNTNNPKDGCSINGEFTTLRSRAACRRECFLSGCFALMLGLLASGCDDSDDGSMREGVFLDSAAAGLNYRTATQRGVTDLHGVFQYRDGEWVNFSVGALDLGRAEGRTVVTPRDLTIDGDHQPHHVTVNTCVFLQTLDSDRNPRNGIVIAEPTRRFFEENDVSAQISFTADAQTFRAHLHGVMESHHLAVGRSDPVAVVSHAAALAHLERTETTLPDPLSRIKGDIQEAMQTYVFQPNGANTWAALRSMISSRLTNEWQEGALAGDKPSDAFAVSVGLGSTMTADDILNGLLRVRVWLRLSSPDEELELDFVQTMATSS